MENPLKIQTKNVVSGLEDDDATTCSPASSTSSKSELRRVVDKLPRRLWAVILIGFWERFTFWGITAPWQNYMEHPQHSQNPPGALALGQAKATRMYCAFYVFYYVTPLFFGVISDRFLGRFRTLCLCLVLYILGCTVVTATSFPASLEQGLGLPGLAIAMVLIGLGGGGFRAVVVPFLADQYTATASEATHRKLENGEVVIADRLLTLQYIWNLYFWAGNLGSLSTFATTLLEKKYSFGYAYATGLVSIIMASFVLFLGGNQYNKVVHHENALPTAYKIMTCAAQEGFRMSHAYPNYQSDHHRKSVTWTAETVDELCRGLKVCQVLLPFVVFYICFDQMQNNLVSQAGQMSSGWIPNDMVAIINSIACIVLGPFIQEVLYPFLERRKIPFKPIARITTGFVFMSLAMLYATIVQQIIYSTEPCYMFPEQCPELDTMLGRELHKVSVWIQAPVYILIAIGELFAYVTALEYAYHFSPKSMEAIVQAISLLIAGMGSACAMGLTPLAQDPYVRTLYACLAVAMITTTLLFWWLFQKHDKLYGQYSESYDKPFEEDKKNPGFVSD